MTDTHNTWTQDIEDILENVRFNSVVLQKVHRKKYLYLKHQLKYYRIPVIIFSACNSVLSVGLQPYLNQQTISITTCLISLIVGIISSIELYLQIQNSMELELTLSKDFYSLAINIFKLLNLNRENRHIDPLSYLDNIYAEYQNLIQKSNLLNSKVQDELIVLPPRNTLKLPMPSTPSSVALNIEDNSTNSSN
jgi:hypothetical protein